jgi:hypothetical protein
VCGDVAGVYGPNHVGIWKESEGHVTNTFLEKIQFQDEGTLSHF